MNTPTRPRRLVLTLSGRRLPRSLGALLRALADDGVPELHAMFIEDSDLLKAVSLPFAFEFCVATSARRPIDRARIEAHLRSEAAAAERDLAELARASGLHWRFEIVREGRIAGETIQELQFPGVWSFPLDLVFEAILATPQSWTQEVTIEEREDALAEGSKRTSQREATLLRYRALLGEDRDS